MQYTNRHWWVLDHYHHVASKQKRIKTFSIFPKVVIFLLIPHPKWNFPSSEFLEPYLFTISLKWILEGKKVKSSSFLFQYYRSHFCQILSIDSLANYFSFSFFSLLSGKWIIRYTHYHLFVNSRIFYSGSWQSAISSAILLAVWVSTQTLKQTLHAS